MADKRTILLVCATIGFGVIASGATIWALNATAVKVSTDRADTVAGISDEARAEAICRRVGAPVIPATDRPTPAQAAQLKDCDSEALYYGQGGPPDYVKARRCAVLEDQRNNEENFHGKTILMQVYANGYGTARNIDLATALACAADTLDGKVSPVLHLQTMDAKSDPFDVCDDDVSGFFHGECTERDSIAVGIERARKIDAVAQSFPTAAPLFADVKSKFATFAEAHADGESYLFGIARRAQVIEERDREGDQFLTDLTLLADDKWPRTTPAAAMAADAALNKSYREALACSGNDANAEDIRITQRAWLAFLDAYVKFAAVAAPEVTPDAILNRLTNLRAAELDELPCSE